MSAIEERFAKIAADLRTLKWMTGTTLAGVVALTIKTLFM